MRLLLLLLAVFGFTIASGPAHAGWIEHSGTYSVETFLCPRLSPATGEVVNDVVTVQYDTTEDFMRVIFAPAGEPGFDFGSSGLEGDHRDYLTWGEFFYGTASYDGKLLSAFDYFDFGFTNFEIHVPVRGGIHRLYVPVDRKTWVDPDWTLASRSAIEVTFYVDVTAYGKKVIPKQADVKVMEQGMYDQSSPLASWLFGASTFAGVIAWVIKSARRVIVSS